MDIDGSITKLLPQNGTKGRVKLLRAIHPHRVKGMGKPKMYIASGADLVEHPKLVWEAREGAGNVGIVADTVDGQNFGGGNPTLT